MMSCGGIAAHCLAASAMDFPIAELLDQQAGYNKFAGLSHPDGRARPRCHARDGLEVHPRRASLLDYRCTTCGRFEQETLKSRVARESEHDRMKRPAIRHRLQRYAAPGLDRNLRGARTQWPSRWTATRGEKGVPHHEQDDPPRRASNRRGHGTFAIDRPPVVWK